MSLTLRDTELPLFIPVQVARLDASEEVVEVVDAGIPEVLVSLAPYS